MAPPELPSIESAQKLIKAMTSPSNPLFDGYLIPSTLQFVKIDRVDGKGTYILRLKTEKKWTNPGGNLHGGIIASMIDVFSGYCVWLHTPARAGDPWSDTGATTNLDISYLAAIPIDSWVEIESSVLSIGKSLAVLRTDMYTLEGPQGGRIKHAVHSTNTRFTKPNSENNVDPRVAFKLKL